MDLAERRAWLRRIALVCAAIVLCVTTLSAYIRLSNAGLGCSDWPQCYGARLRALQHDANAAPAQSDSVTLARSAHRLTAVVALAAMALMLLPCCGRRPWLTREGALVAALIVLALGLAVLGRWSAGARAPAVAIGNLLGGMVMLALCARLALRDAADRTAIAPGWAWTAIAVLLAQMALGASVSASYAGLSCTSLADCWRSAEAAGFPWRTLDPWREPVFAATGMPINADGALVALLHRGAALVVALVLTPFAIAAFRGGRRRAGVALLALLALQVALGLLMTLWMLPLPLALAHNVASGLLLATAARLP